jgi:hypothetical protein
MGMVVPVMIAVVFVRPVAFMYVPAIGIMIVVRMSPIGASIRRSLPFAVSPYPAAALRNPVSIDPYIARAWYWRRGLITQRRRWGPDGNSKGDLSKYWDCKGRSQNTSE